MTLFISEILTLVSEADTKEDKAEVLRVHDSPPLRVVLRHGFDLTVKIVTIPKSIKWESDDAPMGMNPSSIYKAWKQFYLFLEEKEDLPDAKKWRVLTQLLEGMHRDESELYLKILKRQMDGAYKGLTAILINEVFPDLIVESAPQAKEKRKQEREETEKTKKAKKPKEEAQIETNTPTV